MAADKEDESLNKRQKTAISSPSPPWERLPDDLWRIIIIHLHRHHHRSVGSVSLACKRFLLLSNLTLTFFTMKPSVKPVPLPALFSRFPNISSLGLGRDPDLDASITLLANSGLPLKSLWLFRQNHFPKEPMRSLGHRMSKTLKSLSCFGFNVINDDDLAVVATSFPYLQKFDFGISHPRQPSLISNNDVTDRGILQISTRLNSLLSMFIFNHHLTHRSLHYLTSNCPSLRNLQLLHGSIDLDQLDRFDSFQSLSCLRLQRPNISRRVLVGLSNFNLKLEKLILGDPLLANDVTGEVLCRFFKSCRSLRDLQLINISFPADTNAIEFAASLPNIRVIRLREKPNTMPPATLLHLLKDCPLLEEIHIVCSFLGINLNWFNNKSTLFLVRTLDFLCCDDLCDDTLNLLVSVCPKLKALCLMKCSKVTQKGLEAVAASRNNIKYQYSL